VISESNRKETRDKSEINQAPRLEDVRGTRRKDNEVEGSSFEQELRPVPNSLSISTPHHFNSHFFFPTSIPLFFRSRYFNPVPIDRPSRSIRRMRISRYDGESRGGLINE